MKKYKFRLILYFSLVCSLLYVTHHYLNSIYQLNYRQYIFREKTTFVIPSIVVYGNKMSRKKDNTCITNRIPQRKKGWQEIENSHLSLYSAYWDNRLSGNRKIRILAMSKGKLSTDIFCRIWTSSINSYFKEMEVQELWVTSWDLAQPKQYYRPLLLSCEADEGTSPIAVSVTTEVCSPTNNILWLKYDPKEPKKDFVVCLKPLNFKDDITAKLLEWMELQFILGANKIATYVYNFSSPIVDFLKSYEKMGMVSIKYLPKLQTDNDTKEEIPDQEVWQKRRYEMLIYNDCFYNHIHSHQIVVNLDLDEAIIPIKADSWTTLLKQVKKQSPNIFMFASISTANVYFFDSFGMEQDDSIPDYFYMLRHAYRSANFTPPGFAQKSFFLTNNTLIVTNHYALQSIHYKIRVNTVIKKDLAQLNHYRQKCPAKMDEACLTNYMKFKIKDPIILKYKNKLIKNVQNRIKDFKLLNLFEKYNVENKSIFTFI